MHFANVNGAGSAFWRHLGEPIQQIKQDCTETVQPSAMKKASSNSAGRYELILAVVKRFAQPTGEFSKVVFVTGVTIDCALEIILAVARVTLAQMDIQSLIV